MDIVFYLIKFAGRSILQSASTSRASAWHPRSTYFPLTSDSSSYFHFSSAAITAVSLSSQESPSYFYFSSAAITTVSLPSITPVFNVTLSFSVLSSLCKFKFFVASYIYDSDRRVSIAINIFFGYHFYTLDDHGLASIYLNSSFVSSPLSSLQTGHSLDASSIIFIHSNFTVVSYADVVRVPVWQFFLGLLFFPLGVFCTLLYRKLHVNYRVVDTFSEHVDEQTEILDTSV